MINKVKDNLFTIIALLIASAGRFWSLLKYPPSLFSDEVDVALQVKSFLATGRDYYGNFLPLQFHSFSDIRTSIPIYLTALLGKITGDIELAVRLVPALMGILGIFGLYLFVKSLFGKRIALMSALLLTFTPWHFTYSRVGFEVTTLFTFYVFGLYFLHKFNLEKKLSFFIGFVLLFSLSPLVYSTAKLSLFFIPFLIMFYPGSKFRKNITNKLLLLSLVLLFVPVIIVTFSGGISARFNYISIFSDPTIPPELNVARKADQGDDLPVGTSPLLLSKIFRNKFIVYGQRLTDNLFNIISSGFLFSRGDKNLRHALPDWGMLFKSQGILIAVGVYALIVKSQRKEQKYLILFFVVLTFLAIFPGSLTRDGGGHASRSFLLLLPLTLIAALGADELLKRSILLSSLILLVLLFESSFYFFDYTHRYVYLSQRQWHFGLKEVVLKSKNETGPVIITDTYEPPVIFYLYYSGYPVKEMQSLIRADKLLVTIPPGTNLSGRKMTDREVYFASVDNRNDKEPLKLKPAKYYLIKSDLPKHEDYFKPDKVVVKLPSGEPLFYEVRVL